MPVELHELSTDAEFRPIVTAEYEAYSKPFNSFWEILKGPSQEECAARQLAWHKGDPTSHWLYVADTDTREVVCGRPWSFANRDWCGFGPPALPAYWWPE